MYYPIGEIGNTMSIEGNDALSGDCGSKNSDPPAPFVSPELSGAAYSISLYREEDNRQKETPGILTDALGFNY